jgi:PAS domain S-box-containing protein
MSSSQLTQHLQQFQAVLGAVEQDFPSLSPVEVNELIGQFEQVAHRLRAMRSAWRPETRDLSASPESRSNSDVPNGNPLPSQSPQGKEDIVWLVTENHPHSGWFEDPLETEPERIRKQLAALAQRNAQLEVERQRWQEVVEGIADEIWVCDAQGKMSLINLPWVTSMGLQEFKDKTYAEVLDEVEILTLDGQPRPVDQAPLLRSLRDEIVRGEEIMRHRQTGKMRYRHYSAAPMRDGAGSITGAIAIVIDITDRKQAEAEAHAQMIQIELQHRLIDQREQERIRIARDLHDGPVQALTGITFAVSGLLMGDCPPETAQQLEAMQKTIQEQINELRTYAGELRPPALAKFGLGNAIRSHLDTVQEKHPEVQIKFIEEQKGELLPEEKRLAFYRIYQEGLINIFKHAQATLITICLTKSHDQAVLRIQDNGTGFEVPKDWLELARQRHLGLVGMRERAEAIGGQLSIRSTLGKGTTIILRVPLKMARMGPI